MYSFSALSTTALEKLITTYRAALTAEAAGEINYPCGASRKQVEKWLKKAESLLSADFSADNKD